MSDNEEQQKVGIPTQARGQRMGRGEDLDAKRQEMEDGTPALSGVRGENSEMFADASTQHFGGDSVTPDTASPSTPGAIPTGEPLGQSGGERQAKRQIADSDTSETRTK